MIVAVLIAALLLFVPNARTSRAERTASSTNLMLKVLFKALRTGVLEIHGCLGVDWLDSYELRLTKKSVDQFERLLFEETIGASRCDSEGTASSAECIQVPAAEKPLALLADLAPGQEAAPNPRNRSTVFVKKDAHRLRKLLVEYATFKALLYGCLEESDSKMLDVIFSGELEHDESWAELKRFIDKLCRAKGRGDLFVALATNWGNIMVRDVFLSLRDEDSDVILELVEAYVDSNQGGHVAIPLDLFGGLDLECRYCLATTFADLRPYYGNIEWRSFYILSRFSKFPSEGIRATCLKEHPECSIYESGMVQRVEYLPPAETGNCGLEVLPKEVWFEVLLRLDLLSQIYTTPMVCSTWKNWHADLLDQSQKVQEAFARDTSASEGLIRILNLKCYPWNYFLSSHLAALKYLFRYCVSQIQNDALIRGVMGLAWGLFNQKIREDGSSTPLQSYCDIYAQCCKAANTPLEFHQLSGMTDSEYAASIRNLIGQHNIVPVIPTKFVEDGCGRFVSIFKDHGALATLLLHNDSRSCNKLVAHLFSAKSHLPPEIATILDKESTLYRLLFNRDNDIESYLDFILQSFTKDESTYTLAHNIVNLCLLLASGDRSKASVSLRGAISSCFYETGGHELMAEMTNDLGVKILMFLRETRTNYSRDELDAIEGILEQCAIWGNDSKRDIFEACISKFLNDARFTIRLCPVSFSTYEED